MTSVPANERGGELSAATHAPFTYDAFLSYSRHDQAVAEGLQKGLHRIGRKVGRLNALRIFRDKTDLTASPSLMGKITDAMDRSRYFVVVLSPHAAAPEWVDKEVAYWLQHRGADTLLVVLAGGQLRWDETSRRFDPAVSDAATPALTEPGVLESEPIFVDVSADAPWDFQDPRFRDKVSDVAAPIHGKSKYELASADVHEQRRFRRLRRAVVIGSVLLAVIALVAAGLAIAQGREATRQRNQSDARFRIAVGQRLIADANGLLTSRPGTEVQAFQQLLAAHALAASETRSALYNAVIKNRAKRKIVETDGGVIDIANDGSRYLVHESDDITRVRDMNTGAVLGGPPTPDFSHDVTDLNDGWDRVATADDEDPNHDITIRSTETGQPILARLRGHTDTVTYLNCTDDLVSSASDDGTVRVWDTHSGRELRRITVAARGRPQPTGDYWRVRSRLSKNRIMVIRSHNIQVWDVGNGQPVGPPIKSGPDLYFNDAVFSRDGTRLAVSVTNYDDGWLHVWDLATRAWIGEPIMTSPSVPVSNMTFSPDGKRLAYVDPDDDSIRVVDPETGKPLGQPLTGHTGFVTRIEFVGGSNVIASTSKDGTLRLWDVDAGSPLIDDSTGIEHTFTLDGARVAGLHHCADRRSCSIGIWDTSSGKQTVEFAASGKVQFFLAFSPDGSRLMSSPFDDTGYTKVQLWNLATEEADGPPIPLGNHQPGGRFSADGRLIAIPTDGGVAVLGLAERKVITTLPIRATAVAFGPDGRLFTGDARGELRPWDPLTGRPLSEAINGHTGFINALAFSSDGRHLATAGDDGTVRLWLAAALKPDGSPLNGHTDSVLGLAFSPNGQTLASASSDRTVRLWDLKTRQQFGEPLTGIATARKAAEDGFTSVAFTEDGKRIVAGAEDLVAWWPTAATPEDLCAKLTSNMSHQQWDEWVSPDIDYIKVCSDLPVAGD